MTSRPKVSRPKVLFVCLHGSAKSVVAAEHFRRLAAHRALEVDAESAGLEPDAEIPPHVAAGLRADGIDPGALRPRAVTPEQIRSAILVVSFGWDLSGLSSHSRTVEEWSMCLL